MDLDFEDGDFGGYGSGGDFEMVDDVPTGEWQLGLRAVSTAAACLPMAPELIQPGATSH